MPSPLRDSRQDRASCSALPVVSSAAIQPTPTAAEKLDLLPWATCGPGQGWGQARVNWRSGSAACERWSCSERLHMARQTNPRLRRRAGAFSGSYADTEARQLWVISRGSCVALASGPLNPFQGRAPTCGVEAALQRALAARRCPRHAFAATYRALSLQRLASRGSFARAGPTPE